MTAPAAILDDFRNVIALLVDLDDPAATHMAEALSRWIAGEEFESAAGLSPGWRRYLQQTVRDASLSALLGAHPDLDDSGLARRIVDGVSRAARRRGDTRPPGEMGHYYDLAYVDMQLSHRRWRQLIAEARWPSDHRNGHDGMTPCATTGDMNGKKARTT